jgi:hypothetical protein
LTRQTVFKAMRKQIPGRIQTYAVDIGGTLYPIKQVRAQALQVPVSSFISTRARDLLTKLGFDVIDVELDGLPGEPPFGDDLRPLALEFAVTLHANRATSETSEVLATARAFEQYLSAR